MSTFDRIVKLLEEQGKRQKDLTDYLGISKNAFTDWKSGRIKSYLKYIDKIAEFFDVSADYLLGKTEDRRPKTDKITKEDIKFALFDGENVTEEMFNDVLDYVEFIKNKYKKDDHH